MFKEIEEPDFYKKKVFNKSYPDDKFFYNEKTEEYLNIDLYGKHYFNENGWHKLDGPAFIKGQYYFFYINGNQFFLKEFAKETNHLICKFCEEFCKQECFL